LKILLVRLRLIGDVVFTTPLLRALRRHEPGAELTYLVERAAAPVVRGNPHLSDLIVVPHRRGLARVRDDIRLARELRRRRFDVAIDLHGGPRSAWLTWASGAKRRIGYPMAGRQWMYTDLVERAPDLGPRHSVANQWDLLRPLGIGAPDPEADPVEIAEDPDAAARVSLRLAAAGLKEHRLVVIHVSAGNPFRRWPEEAFAASAEQLVRNDPSRRVLFTSGPSDADAARRIADAARRRLGPLAAGIADAGEFDLAELHSLIGRAAVYIGGDSGPLHIAATTPTPIVALFGPTLPGRSMPWRSARYPVEAVDAGPLPCRPCRQRTCAPGDFRCLTRITPEQLVRAAERAMTR
jgi:lipopolysaccharide heptosyltransferase II